MNTRTHLARRKLGGRSAFTLVELMVSMAIFTMVIGGVVYAHITGLKMYELTKAKLGANDQTRTALGLLTSEVRTAKTIDIGSMSGSTFTPAPDGSPQQGNALQIQPTTNTSDYIRYYLDTNVNVLKRVTSGVATPSVVAQNITNTVVFTSEDYTGTVLTGNQNNRVLGITLQFYQIQYPVVQIGGGELYDFYQLRTRVTRRALE